MCRERLAVSLQTTVRPLDGRLQEVVGSQSEQFAIAHDDLAIDDHRPDIDGGGGIDEGRAGIRVWGGRAVIEVDQLQVGPFADLDRADLVVETKGARTVDRRHPDQLPRGQARRAVEGLRQEGGGPHLREHIEAVVAGSAIGTEGDIDSGRPQGDDIGDPRAELEIGRGAVGNVSPGLSEDLPLALVEMDAVGENDVRTGQMERVEVGQIAQTGSGLDHGDLFPVLGGMGVDQHATLAGEFGRLREQFPCTAQRETGSQTGLEATVLAPVPSVDQARRLGKSR